MSVGAEWDYAQKRDASLLCILCFCGHCTVGGAGSDIGTMSPSELLSCDIKVE